MKCFIAYWKYKDWVETCNANPAYHSNAKILKDIAPGSELWLFTRKPRKQTIHVVQKIKIKPYPSSSVRKKKKYVVVGDGLANSTTIQATREAIDEQKNCWLKVLSHTKTVRGKTLKSDTAGKFAERVQSPRAITPESAALLAAEWTTRFG